MDICVGCSELSLETVLCTVRKRVRKNLNFKIFLYFFHFSSFQENSNTQNKINYIQILENFENLELFRISFPNYIAERKIIWKHCRKFSFFGKIIWKRTIFQKIFLKNLSFLNSGQEVRYFGTAYYQNKYSKESMAIFSNLSAVQRGRPWLIGPEFEKTTVIFWKI